MYSHLLLGLTMSFLGSLPVGMISLVIVETTINRSAKQGLFASIGASMVECIQAFIAITFIALFVAYPLLEDAITVLSIPIFAFFAYTHLRSDGHIKGLRKPAAADETILEEAGTNAPKIENSYYKGHSFLRGAFISSLNIMVFPYWILWGGVFIKKSMLVPQFFYTSIFAFGVGIGTFLAMSVYVLLGIFLHAKLQKYNLWMNRFIGMLFLVLALVQLYQLFV